MFRNKFFLGLLVFLLVTATGLAIGSGYLSYYYVWGASAGSMIFSGLIEAIPAYIIGYAQYVFGVSVLVVVVLTIILLRNRRRKGKLPKTELYQLDSTDINWEIADARILSIPYETQEPKSETSETEVVSNISMTNEFVSAIQNQQNTHTDKDRDSVHQPPDDEYGWLLYSPKAKKQQ